MDWFVFWLNNFVLIAQGCLHLFFVCRFTRKKLKVRYIIVYLFLLYGSDLAAYAVRSSGLAICAALLILYGMNRLLLGNSRPVSCVAAVLAVYVTQLSFGAFSSIEFLFFNHALGHSRLLYLLVTLAMLLALALSLFCYKFITNRFTLQDHRREHYVWMLLPPSLFFFTVELYIFNTAYEPVLTVPYAVETGKHLALLGLQLLSLGALFCALYAYRRTCEGLRAEAAAQFLTQQTQAQKSYVVQAQMRCQRTQAFRHDIKNHLTVLNGLLKNGNYKQALVFLQRIETAANEMSIPIHTGNPVVDVLLGDKLALAKTSGAEVEISLTLPEQWAVDDLDLCIIFSNALDNAIRACLEIDGLKTIRITGIQQGEFYMLEFENTCALESSPVMGTGLSNVKMAAEKYGGAMIIEQSDALFRLNVLLNISVLQRDSS